MDRVAGRVTSARVAPVARAALAFLAALLLLPAGASAAVHVRRGDWEGTSYQGSLIVKRVTIGGKREDVIRGLIAKYGPICRGNPGPQPALFEPGVLKQAVVHANGDVAASRKVVRHGQTIEQSLNGRFSNGHYALLTLHESTTRRAGWCDDTQTIVFEPVVLPRIRDGLWRGRASDGEPIEFGVGFDGRAVVHVRGLPFHLPFMFGKWSCSRSSGTCTAKNPRGCAFLLGDMLIYPTGVFEFNSGDPDGYPAITARFKAPTKVSGSWSNPAAPEAALGGSCAGSWTAKLVRR